MKSDAFGRLMETFADVLAVVLLVVLGAFGAAAFWVLLDPNTDDRCALLKAEARAVETCSRLERCTVDSNSLQRLYERADWYQAHCAVKP